MHMRVKISSGWMLSSLMFSNIFIHRCPETLVLLIPRTKLIKRNKKLAFMRNYYHHGKIMELLVKFHAQKGGTEIIPSYLVISSRLKKLTQKDGTKISQTCFLSRPTFYINYPKRSSCNNQTA